MGNLLGIIAALLAGKTVAGLTLVEIEAIAGLLLKYEPQIESFVAWVKQVEPQLYDELTKAAKNVATITQHKVSTIPGYAGDGSVTSVPNPD